MKTYTYWSNKNYWKEKKLKEIKANSITEADLEFEKCTNLNPIKINWIGVTIE